LARAKRARGVMVIIQANRSFDSPENDRELPNVEK
jgi:hypothetical protein